jgi:hypothetical protein
MKNKYITPADFWRERDFGAKISAVFEFIGAHWRPLGKCLLYFVLPCALLMGIGMGLFTNSMYNKMGSLMGGAAASRQLGGPVEIAPQYGSGASPLNQFNLGGIAVGFLGSMLSFLLLVGTVFGYVRARLRLPAATPITPAVVWAELKGRIGRMLLVVGLVMAVYLLLAFGFSLLIAISANRGGLNSVTAIMLGFLVFGTLATYLGVVLSLFFPVLWLEDGGVFATVGRCFQLIKGRWWATFGLLLVVAMIQGMLLIVFIIPQYAVMIGKMMHVPSLSSDVLGLVAQCIYAVGIMFTYTIPLLALAFQYFHLAEQKEGWGLRLLVDALGQPQAIPVAHSGHYRPDDEGEY